MDTPTKAGLLDLLDEATEAGWTLRRACGVLELGEVRAHRWIARRARGQLVDLVPGGHPVHGLLRHAESFATERGALAHAAARFRSVDGPVSIRVDTVRPDPSTRWRS